MQCTWRSDTFIKPVMIMLAFSQRQSANDPFPLECLGLDQKLSIYAFAAVSNVNDGSFWVTLIAAAM